MFLAAFALGGCGIQTTATVLHSPPHPLQPRGAETVELFSSAAPARPHVDVAFIEATEQSWGSSASVAQIMNELRKRAAQLGCDGVVIGSRFARVDDLNTLLTGNAHDVQGLTGTCIVYTDAALTTLVIAGPSSPPAAACSEIHK